MSKNEVKQGVLQRLLRGATEIKWGKSIMSGEINQMKEMMWVRSGLWGWVKQIGWAELLIKEKKLLNQDD